MHEVARLAVETDTPLADLVRLFYGPTGPLAAAGWEIRPQQVEMSTDIAEAMDKGGGWVCHEAPCGVGKGLSYLLPGILGSLRAEALVDANAAEAGQSTRNFPKLVVSTANIALQSQLVEKDIPALAKMLDVEVRAFIQKGVGNYACRESLGEIDALDDDARRIKRWAEQSGATGDREALPWDPGTAWGRVARLSDDCLKRSCEHYPLQSPTPCFWRLAQRGKEQAHVVVTNHAMLARAPAGKTVLLAIDEAHALEGSLRGGGAFGLREGSGRGVANRCAEYVGPDVAVDRIEVPAREVYRRAAAMVEGDDPFVLVEGWAGDDLDHPLAMLMEGRLAMEAAADRAGCRYTEGLGWAGASGDPESGKVAAATNAVIRLLQRCEVVAKGGGGDDTDPVVVYAQPATSSSGKRFIDVEASPIDVSGLLLGLSKQYPTAAFTSATLPADAALDAALGTGPDGDLPWAARKRLPSPYDLPALGLLVVPQGPNPKDRTWRSWACQQVVEVVAGAQGRTLVLSSSWAQAREYAAALRDAGGPWPLLVQGEAGRAVLRQRFRDEVDSVLVGTRSFFEGLDVQGESLSCVVVDRIPFARPDEVVENAVGTYIAAKAGGSAYMLRTIPEAATILAQGAGRLIRSPTDRGVLVILDTRILLPGGGWKRLANALPPFRRSRTVADVARFLAGAPLEAVVEPKPRGRMVLSDWE